jgi:hypothetical protein
VRRGDGRREDKGGMNEWLERLEITGTALQ